MSTAQAYPLHWPSHVPRTTRREKSKFKTSLSAALNNVRKSLALFGSDSRKAVTNLVLSSNVSLGHERPADPGVAVWFTWDGLSVCIPVDRYERPEENLQAIHHIIEARRTELRHGTLTLVRATFQGFTALPAPPGAAAKRPWREVLGWAPHHNPSREEIEASYRGLAKQRHPDAPGGSHAAMAELNAAREEALK